MYPDWANAIGWVIAMTLILAVPIVAVVQIVYKVMFVHDGNFRKALDELLKPTTEWRKTANRIIRRETDSNANGGFVNVGMTPIADEKRG